MKLEAKSRLLAIYGTAYHITEARYTNQILQQGLTLNQEPQGKWKGHLTYSKPSIFLSLSNKLSDISEIMSMVLSKKWYLEEWSNFDDHEMAAVMARYRLLEIKLSLVPDAVLHQDPLNDNSAFKYITVPVPADAVVGIEHLPKGWRDH